MVNISCQPLQEYENNPNAIKDFAKACKNSLIKLDSTATAFQLQKIDQDSLQKAITEARLAYKKIEFYVAYLYPEFTNEHLNGAPLLHIEKEGSQPSVLKPEGLQILDEMIFSENAKHEKTQVASLAKKIKTQYSIIYPELISEKPKQEEIVNAMRLQLVRIFTLGVTGFDTPGSVNGLEESKLSLQSMAIVFSNYATNLDRKKTKKIQVLFNEGIQSLQTAKSFETFDRLTFFMDYLDPLYKNLGELQQFSENEFLSQTTSWNPKSTSIFSTDFLNPYFFTNVKKEEDNRDLKELGKTLFYEPLLSSTSIMSCASCHKPDKAFTDGTAKSISNIEGKTVLRNAPTLLNAVYADRYFYDLRAFTLEQQMEHVIFNPSEFNTAYTEIVKKLSASPKYVKKFKSVFHDSEITREKFSKALVSYVLSLQSFNSPFDKYVRKESKQIDPAVKKGFNIFMGKGNCATCHFAPTFSGLVPPLYSDSESEILGILKNPKVKKIDSDKGRFDNAIFSEKAWIYEKSFKTTTVRNVKLTAPYFHNGAYNTLEEVMDFYNNGGGAGTGLQVKNQTLPANPLDLTETEIQNVIAFLNALTDSNYNSI